MGAAALKTCLIILSVLLSDNHLSIKNKQYKITKHTKTMRDVSYLPCQKMTNCVGVTQVGSDSFMLLYQKNEAHLLVRTVTDYFITLNCDNLPAQSFIHNIFLSLFPGSVETYRRTLIDFFCQVKH